MRRAAATSTAEQTVPEHPASPDRPVVTIPKPGALGTDELRSHVNPALAQKLVVDDRILPASREQYRRLAAALHQAREATGLSVVMIASAAAGEGKSLTAANLSITLSESYQQRVLLVDADLRRPTQHTIFKTSRSPGLTDALTTVDERQTFIQDLSPHLSLLPAGKLTVDPIAGLTSARMRHILESARATFSWVIIDTPPVGVLTDASLLSNLVDGTVLVVKADSTPYDLTKRAVDALGTDRLVGVVLNRAVLRAHRYSYGYGDYAKYLSTDSER
jgi:capsular exopolysaccharide synthesis family protein